MDTVPLSILTKTDATILERLVYAVEEFYIQHNEIKESHGIRHVMAVYEHAKNAVLVQQQPSLSSSESLQVLIAALLHDVDDTKYFPTQHQSYENACQLMSSSRIGLSREIQENVLEMISFVSCSINGNSIPEVIQSNELLYWKLIPRWADRLEAVGAVGVVRCYQYNTEHGLPLYSDSSPKAKTEKEVWEYATSERFQNYNGQSTDMISHYYDKLLHVARPSPKFVRNEYLESQALVSCTNLIEVCIRFGNTGKVDIGYIEELAKQISKD